MARVPHNQTKIGKLVEQLRIALRAPANSWQEIVDRIALRTNRRVRRSDVMRAAARVRKNQQKLYDWNIPHIGPGAASSDPLDQGRLHRVVRGVPRTSGQRRHRKRGTLRLWRMNHTMLSNQVRIHEEEREVSSPAVAAKMDNYIVLLKASVIHLATMIDTLDAEVQAEERSLAA